MWSFLPVITNERGFHALEKQVQVTWPTPRSRLDEKEKAFQEVADLIVTMYEAKNGEVPEHFCFENNGELINPAVMFTNLKGSLKDMTEDLVCNSPSKKQEMETTTRPYATGRVVLTQKDQDAPIRVATVLNDNGGDVVYYLRSVEDVKSAA